MSTPADTFWTKDRTETLKVLWTEGKSASQIADILGDGCTRAAVCGKVSRLDLPERGAAFNRERSKPTTVFGKPRLVPPKPKPAPLIPDGRSDLMPEPRAVPLERRVGVIGLELQQCRWPVGCPQSPDFHFCDQQAMAGVSYCSDHMRRAYNPVRAERPLPAAAKTVVGPLIVDVDAVLEDA